MILTPLLTWAVLGSIILLAVLVLAHALVRDARLIAQQSARAATARTREESTRPASRPIVLGEGVRWIGSAPSRGRPTQCAGAKA